MALPEVTHFGKMAAGCNRQSHHTHMLRRITPGIYYCVRRSSQCLLKFLLLSYSIHIQQPINPWRNQLETGKEPVTPGCGSLYLMYLHTGRRRYDCSRPFLAENPTGRGGSSGGGTYAPCRTTAPTCSGRPLGFSCGGFCATTQDPNATFFWVMGTNSWNISRTPTSTYRNLESSILNVLDFEYVGVLEANVQIILHKAKCKHIQHTLEPVGHRMFWAPPHRRRNNSLRPRIVLGPMRSMIISEIIWRKYFQCILWLLTANSTRRTPGESNCKAWGNIREYN